MIAFGPVSSIEDYGVPNEFAPFDMTDDRELELRSPGRWISTITTRTFVLEGERGNAAAMHVLEARANHSRFVQLIMVRGEDHFSTLGPRNQGLARQIAGSWRTDKVLRLE